MEPSISENAVLVPVPKQVAKKKQSDEKPIPLSDVREAAPIHFSLHSGPREPGPPNTVTSYHFTLHAKTQLNRMVACKPTWE